MIGIKGIGSRSAKAHISTSAQIFAKRYYVGQCQCKQEERALNLSNSQQLSQESTVNKAHSYTKVLCAHDKCVHGPCNGCSIGIQETRFYTLNIFRTHLYGNHHQRKLGKGSDSRCNSTVTNAEPVVKKTSQSGMKLEFRNPKKIEWYHISDIPHLTLARVTSTKGVRLTMYLMSSHTTNWIIKMCNIVGKFGGSYDAMTIPNDPQKISQRIEPNAMAGML